MLLASQFAAISMAASPPVQRTTTAGQTVPVSQSFILRRDSYQAFEVDSFSANATVDYNVTSSAPVSVALMTGDQYNTWQNDLTDPISNSITYVNGTSVQNSVPLQPGQYFLVFYAYLSRSLVEFGLQIYPSTPYSYGPISPPLASGIASFGISNSSGTVSSYQVQTSQVVGLASISSFQVSTFDAYRYDTHTSGATLQLNAMLVVNDSGTQSQKVYWVQNVPDFVTAASQVSFGDEIWNNTDTTGFLSNQTITSTNFANGGFVYNSGTGRFSTGPNLYAYSMNNATYRLPLDFGMMVKATVIPGTGVLVQSGYRVLSNGSAISSPTVWYDNVTIHDTAASAAYFDVTGNASTPTGHYYDAELVFAGEGNLETAHFIELNATLGLFYQNAKGQLASYPTYYGFGGDTGESADDLVVTYANGLAQVSPGINPNYSYLGSGSLSLDPNSLLASSQTTTQTTTTTTSTQTTTTTTSTTRSTSTTSTTSTTAASTSSTSTSTLSSPTTVSRINTGSNNSSTQPLELSTRSTNSQSSAPLGGYLLVFVVGAIVGVVFAIFALALVRRRPPPPPQF